MDCSPPVSSVNGILPARILEWVALFLVQEGNDQGIGVVAGGSSDSYYSKAKGRTLEEQLKTWTVVCCVLFAIVSVVLYLSLVKAW